MHNWKSTLNVVNILLTMTVVFSVTGCASISRSDRQMLRQIESYGLGKTDEEIKKPVMAAVLNLLPGIGNFYLATGTEQGDQWIYGTCNLLLWPISPIWAVPQAAIDAGTINKLETIYYYQYDQIGRQELAAAKARMNQL
ncbi:MAG: hypothetical protein ISR85_05665 [Kiritimatiellales bacterium]|nr:hypothetical protein [Kiritimatiellota bacterium]MBL7012399.1 hypothetical protein [Kiritimatiellales bacterium]